MNRRKFFRDGSLLAIGTTIVSPFINSNDQVELETSNNKKAQNIIFIVSDGMSSGTLNMANLLSNRKFGINTNWMQLYADNRVTRALMDTASANSIVTDSSAASSSWGGGFRVNNGAINTSPSGEEHLPIWQKFKKSGKMTGCVTTVPITHATPAGFCVSTKSRNDQEKIAELYLDLEFDVMMGGGAKYFSKESRKDKKDMYADFAKKGYQIARNKKDLENHTKLLPLLGVFAEDALPYSIERNNDRDLQNSTPTLAEMTATAINRMKAHPKGFVLQVEAGKVDWAAHANDIAGLLYDQLALDEAIKVAIDFAEKDKNTLVIITTDHGNANPGVVYGKYADKNFDSIQHYKHNNEWILNSIHSSSTTNQVQEIVKFANGIDLPEESAKELLTYYSGLDKQEDGLYNYRKLPFNTYSKMQFKYNSVNWISMDHSADYVELAMFGPGSQLLKPFIKNTDLHYLMLEAAEIENKF